MTLSELLEEALKSRVSAAPAPEVFMNIFEYLKFCSEVVPGLAEMSHSETDLAVDIGDYLRVCRSDPRTMMKMDNGMGIRSTR